MESVSKIPILAQNHSVLQKKITAAASDRQDLNCAKLFRGPHKIVSRACSWTTLVYKQHKEEPSREQHEAK